MKKVMYKSRLHLMALGLALLCGKANATVYTAVLSGNFGSALTWGGIVPGALLSSDIVVIPSGINVTLTGIQTLSGTTTLTVNGTLTSTATGTALVMPSGALAGTGTISVDSMALGLTSGFTFTGALKAKKLTTTGANIATAATVTVNNALRLTSGALNLSAGHLYMGNNSTITLLGGTINSSGTGVIHLDSAYDVVYTTVSATSGIELTGTGLDSITVNTPGTVTLSSNVAASGVVTLSAGTLALNSHGLTFNSTGDLSAAGTGSIMGSATSDIVVNSTAGLTGALRFATGGNMLNNLTVNTGSAGIVALGTNLTTNGMVTLSGGNLSFNGHTFTFGTTSDLAASGTGAIMGSSSSNVIVNSTAGLTGALRFATGANTLNNLTVNTASGSNVSLGTDFVSSGMVVLSNGTLSLNGHTLTFNTTGDLSAAGTGTLMGSTLSNIIVNNTSGLTGALRFATGGNTLNNLTVNTATGSNVTLGNDLTFNGLVTLSAGSLVLNGHSLTFNGLGDFATAGTGDIMSGIGSSITVNSTAGLAGALRFAAGGNVINNLTINSSGGNVQLGTNVTVNGMIALSSGNLAFNGYTLTLGTGADLSASGTGAIMGSSSSNLVINSTTGLTGALRFATGSSMLNNLTINTAAGSTVSLGSDLTSAGLTTLTNGTLSLNGHTLTFGTTGDLSATGTGTIMGSTASSIVVNSTAGLTGMLRFATGGNTLNNLTVNTGSAASVMLGNDLNTNGLMTLTSGTLDLNGHSLIFNAPSDLSATGAGTIMGSTTSNLTVNSTAGLTGALVFATGGSLLNNLTVNTGSTGTVALGTNITVNGMVTLSNGSLSFNGHILTLGATSDLSATGTGNLMGSTSSNLVVNSTAGLTGTLRFATGGNILNNLTVNTAAGSNVLLGSDLTSNGTVILTSGTLALNGHTLTFGTTGDLSAAGTGAIMGSSLSSIVVNTTAGLSSPLRFTTGSSVLNNLTVNTGATSNVMLNSDLTTNGMVTLSAGNLSLNGHSLTFNTSSDLATTGTGSIAGSATSGIIVNSISGLSGTLRFATGSNMLNNFTVNTAAANTVTLGSDLNVNSALNLQSGKVKLGASNLNVVSGATVNGGSANSYVLTNGTGKLTMNLAAGAIDSFKVGTTSAYAPMVIKANTGAATSDVSINVADGVLAGGTTGTSISATQAVVNATWFVSSSVTSGINYDMTAMWNAGMEVNSFNRSHAYISHYTAGAWDAQTMAAAGVTGSMYTMSRTGITSLSPFMVTDHDLAPTSTSNVAATVPVVSIYPNPATSTLHLSSSVSLDNAAIYDMSGRQVQSTDLNSNAISIANLPAGSYMIHFTGKDADVVKQFIKQ